MSTTRRTIALAAAVVVIFPFSAMASGGASTPEGAFEKFKTAMDGRDYRAGCEQMTPNLQDSMLGGMAMAVSSGFGTDRAKAPQIQKLFEKHGIKAIDVAKVQPDQDLGATLRESVADVKDKPQCFAELMVFLESNPPSNPGKMADPKSQGPAAGVIALIRRTPATLANVKTHSDSARGTLKMSFANKEISVPMDFKKVDGSWYIDMAVPAGGPPAQSTGLPSK